MSKDSFRDMNTALNDLGFKFLDPKSKIAKEALSSIADLDPDEIYAAGLKEGARRERRALSTACKAGYVPVVAIAWVRKWLVTRSKRKGKK